MDIKNSAFLKAARREKTDHTPVWIMRQAGRYLKEYNQVKEKAGTFEVLCKTPEYCAEVTLQPVRRFGMDAAILFSDILVVIEALGGSFSFEKDFGPKVFPVVNSFRDLQPLKPTDPDISLNYVMETITILKQKLAPMGVPLIGFSGAPFTLLTYLVEGGSTKHFLNTKKIMFSDEKLFRCIMELLTEMIVLYAKAQIRAGIDAFQLFDTWAGILGKNYFDRRILPFVKKIISEIKKSGIPVIYYINGAAHLIDSMIEASPDVLGIDQTVSMKEAMEKATGRFAIQGNLEPGILYSSKEQLEKETAELLSLWSGKPGHIFNLGHGIMKDAAPEKVELLVNSVKRISSFAN